MHCLRNCSRKFAIFASSIFSLILASAQSWNLEFWRRYNLCNTAARGIFKTCVYRTHRTRVQLCAVMVVLKVTTSHFVSKSQQPTSIISFGQSIIECIVQFYSRARCKYSMLSLFVYLIVHLNCIFVGIKLFSFYFVSFVVIFISSVFLTTQSTVRSPHPAPRPNVFGTPTVCSLTSLLFTCSSTSSSHSCWL